MTVFDICINGSPYGVFGIQTDGVFTTIVNQVRRSKKEEILLQLGGLQRRSKGRKENLCWKDRPLKQGDEITIRIRNGSKVDKPELVSVEDPVVEAKLKGEYLKRLKKELGEN